MNPTTLRKFHFYIGMFIAPSVLFFACTGTLQLFSLHEAHGTYVPPPIIEKLSSVHKDQVFALGHHHATANPPQEDAVKPLVDGNNKRMKPSTLLLKLFFCTVALGLIASTVLGLWIGLTHPLRRRTAGITALVGAVIPIGLLLL